MGVQGKYTFPRAVLVIVVEHDRGDMAVHDVDQDVVLCDNVHFNPAIAQDFVDLCTVVQGTDKARNFAIDKLRELARQCDELPLASVVATCESLSFRPPWRAA